MSHDPAVVSMPAWRQRFDALVAERMRRPFIWGQHDCCLWAADVVCAVAGFDPAAAERGRYASEADAQRMLAELGGLRAVGARAGQAIRPLQAGCGDVGLVSWMGRESLAACDGQHWLVPAARGLAALPLGAALAAWRVIHA